MKGPIVALAGAAVIRALGTTWRVRCEGMDHYDRAYAHSPNVIFAFWHGRLLPLAYSHRGRQIQVLASEHRDGEMLGLTIRRLGFGHVRGSSTRGGARAIRELVSQIRSGRDVGLTVDGPRGPRHVVKPGAIEVARATGAAILPITSASRRHRTLSSWDAFELPYPFTAVRIQYGAPILVDPGTDDETRERMRLELEKRLLAITEQNDAAVHDRR